MGSSRVGGPINRIYDVAVIGAGPGGSAAATHLARRGLRVLLIDKGDFPRDKTCGDGLSPRAVVALQELGVLEEIQPHSYELRELSIRGPGGSTVTAFLPEHPALPSFALVTPRLVLDEALRARAAAAGAFFLGRTRVTLIERQAGVATLTGTRAGETIRLRARAVALATGVSSRLLDRLRLLPGRPKMMLAARAYFEDLPALEGRLQFRFDGIPLPGYGWVFPLGDSTANIGAGYYRSRWKSRRAASNAQQVFDAFIHHPQVSASLQGARQVGPVKGFPLRVDFTSAPTATDGLVLIGEAAGLVNPLTGEGVDNALESGALAAEHLVAALEAGDLSHRSLASYDVALRRRFQRQFIFCEWVRALFMNHLLLDRLVHKAGKRPDLKRALIKIALGYPDALANMKLRKVLQLIWS